MRNYMLFFAALVCCSVACAQQKLPTTVAEIDTVLAEYDKKVLPTSQFLLMDINDDGVKDIVIRDEDAPHSGYAVIVCRDGKLEVENFAYDGYERLGYAEGGISVYEHDDHMGMEMRTWNTIFCKYKKGVMIMKGEHDLTISKPRGDEDEGAEEDGYNVEESFTINEQSVTEEKWKSVLPEIKWFDTVKEGWQNVMGK